MAIAWLLVSSVDVDHCESVLGSVLRPEDLDRAFGSGDLSEGTVTEACEGVLQGLAALEVSAFGPYRLMVTECGPILTKGWKLKGFGGWIRYLMLPISLFRYLFVESCYPWIYQ